MLAGVLLPALLPSVRVAALQAAGRALVAEDALGPVDLIVTSVDADGAGVLEAADLVRDGLATRVAVFGDPPDEVDQEFMRRGLPYEDAGALSVRQLRMLGVETVEQIPRTVSGTEDEGSVLPEWCRERRVRSLILVGLRDHTRRLTRVMRRTMAGSGVRVIVRGSRYSPFDPERWWETRAGLRIGIVEIQKLVRDVARHPLS